MKAAIIAAITASIISATAATAAQSWINGSSIRPHSIPANRLTTGAVASLHGVRGAPGTSGPEGPQGPQGPLGLQGLTGPAGGFDLGRISYVDSGRVTVAPGVTDKATAPCPAGKKAIGGGFILGHGSESIDVHGSVPAADGSAWLAAVSNNTAIDAYVEAFAVCAG